MTAVVLGIWAMLAISSVFDGRAAAVGGLDRLETIRDGFEIEQIESGELISELSAASDDFSSAQSELRSPWVTPLRIVPWIGTQIRSADALSNSASIVANELAEAAARVVEVKDESQAELITKAGASRELLAVVRAARARFADLDLGPAGGLVGALEDARRRFEEERNDLDATLADAEVALTGMTEFLSGPTTYLLLSANTSEMRAGSGRFLIAGPVSVRDGDISVGDLVSPEDILLEPDAVEIADVDFATNWSDIGPNVDLRNLGTTPRFDVTAPLAADMWQAITGQRVDGVLVIDPVALQGILGTGTSVEVDGLQIDAENVFPFVVLDQYWEADKPTRRLRQRELASAALSAAVSAGTDLVELVETLESAVAGRHILAWSRSGSQQAAWELLGADGRIGTGSLMASLVNDGLNKLDTFVEVNARATSIRESAGVEVALTLDLVNGAGTQLPEYVLGPYEWLGLELGTYIGTLAVNLPEAATDIAVNGPGNIVVWGTDGPTKVVALSVEIAAGRAASYEIEFTLPPGAQAITIEPSARMPGVSWNFDGVIWRDTEPRTIDLQARDYGTAPAGDALRIASIGSQSLVPPSPSVRLSEDGSGATVGWRVTPGTTGVVVWALSETNEWHVIEAAGGSTGEVTVRLDPSATRFCARTSLSEDATMFSSTNCAP
ncbi:MAG: DUF4012 domain-containing protein [Acidimicrobiia bacterium]|nr:DUF4012 domain-containing protein [Acidimicrobiia bacterium]